MNTLGAQPWRVTFSFSRALQTPALNAWKGNPANVNRAQQLFLHRCKCVSAASQGSYKDFMEKEI
jgi:fructose-bisphosphate aldolase class I